MDVDIRSGYWLVVGDPLSPTDLRCCATFREGRLRWLGVLTADGVASLVRQSLGVRLVASTVGKIAAEWCQSSGAIAYRLDDVARLPS
jgi:hypothetical protein